MTGKATDDDWSLPTHYTAGQAVEPRMFTEADPMTAGMILDWSNSDETTDHWGATTLVGRPRRRDRGRIQVADSVAPGLDGAEPVTTGQVDATATEVEVVDRPAPKADRGLMANSRSMAIASLASRVTGFLRSVMLVAALGGGSVSIAYNSGNNLPNMIYELMLGGVLSSVLIPLLVKAEDQDEDGGLAYTQRLLSIATVVLAAMTILVTAAAPWIAAAFVRAGPQRELTSVFATLLLPEIFFYGLGAMFMAVLNIRHVYGPGAWSPLLNNVVMMVTVAVFWMLPGPKTLDPSSMTTTQILVIGIGTTLGIAAQALVLIPSLRRTGFRWAWRFRAHAGEKDRMKEVGALTGWVLGYVVVSQIGVSVIQKVGNDNGGFTVFTNVDLLFQMPYGILVVSLLTAIMPRLSRAAVQSDFASVIADLSLGARLSAVALVPVTALLLVLGPVTGVTLFAHGRTSFAIGHLMGTSLALSAFGLFPFALVMLQLRIFYAMRDGRTPTLINIAMVATKVVLVLVTDHVLRNPHAGHVSVGSIEWLNISTSMSYLVGAVAGHVLLTRRLGRLGFGKVLRTVVLIAVPSAIGASAAWGVVQSAFHVIGRGVAGSAAGLVAGGIVGLALTVVVAWRMRIGDVREALSAGRA